MCKTRSREATPEDRIQGGEDDPSRRKKGNSEVLKKELPLTDGVLRDSLGEKTFFYKFLKRI